MQGCSIQLGYFIKERVWVHIPGVSAQMTKARAKGAEGRTVNVQGCSIQLGVFHLRVQAQVLGFRVQKEAGKR